MFLSFMGGTLFGVFIMCLMQIKKGSDYEAAIIVKERDNNEQIE